MASLRVICMAAILALPVVAHADEPRLVGEVELGGAVAALEVAANGQLAVTQMAANNGQPAGLQVVDTSVPDKPQPRALAPIERNGAMSLSGEGRRLLLLLAPARVEFNKPGKYSVAAFDLADAGAPREAWRKEITALRVLLAPNALGYAVLLPVDTDRPGRDGVRVEVHWADGKRPDRVVESDDGRQSTPLPSSNASFLLMWGMNQNLRVFDLRPDEPVLTKQNGFSSVDTGRRGRPGYDGWTFSTMANQSTSSSSSWRAAPARDETRPSTIPWTRRESGSPPDPPTTC